MHRGPRRDLVAEFANAASAQGLRFGVYYSSGLDWGYTDLPPYVGDNDEWCRANDLGYLRYASAQVVDLIERFRPALLWGDMGWPDDAVPPGPDSFEHLLDIYYATVPDGVVNDRWNITHLPTAEPAGPVVVDFELT